MALCLYDPLKSMLTTSRLTRLMLAFWSIFTVAL